MLRCRVGSGITQCKVVGLGHELRMHDDNVPGADGHDGRGDHNAVHGV